MIGYDPLNKFTNYYLYAYPDAQGAWVGVGWFWGVDALREAVKNFPESDSGWWYAFGFEPTGNNPDRDKNGRYEVGPVATRQTPGTWGTVV